MNVFFDWWQYEFMRYAFFAILLITPLFGLLGTLVVSNGLAFFSDALGHSILTGVGIGVILNLSQYMPVMIVFAVLFALVMNKIRHSNISSSDTVIGVFSSCGVALGLVILSKNGGFSKYKNLLIGDILTVTKGDIITVAILLVLVFLIWIFLFNSMLSSSINSSLAKVKGVPVNLIDNFFVVLVAIIVVLAIQWVGLLIVNALLVLPAAASRNISKNTQMYNFLALIFAVFSGIWGLIFSYYFSISTGPTIVLIAAALFFGTFVMNVISRKRKSKHEI